MMQSVIFWCLLFLILRIRFKVPAANSIQQSVLPFVGALGLG
jgi:hypothetical protein